MYILTGYPMFKMCASINYSKSGMRDRIYVYLVIISIYKFEVKTVEDLAALRVSGSRSDTS